MRRKRAVDVLLIHLLFGDGVSSESQFKTKRNEKQRSELRLCVVMIIDAFRYLFDRFYN